MEFDLLMWSDFARAKKLSATFISIINYEGS